RHGDVVDAVEADVGQRREGGRLAGAAHARDDEQLHDYSTSGTGTAPEFGRVAGIGTSGPRMLTPRALAAIRALIFSWKPASESWPRNFCTCWRGTTSSREAMLRPGRSRIRASGTPPPRIGHTCGSVPRRS